MDKLKKLNKTTWEKVAKDNPKDFLSVVIGDDKEKDFKPQAKIQRWDNEANISIRLKETPEELKETPTITEKNGKIEFKKSKREAHFYDIAPNTEHPEGASEFEVILKEKPDTNVVEFTVVDKDVDYFYQPPLTPEEIAQGSSRPENVEGSYAVYAKTPKTNYTGGKEYKVGKIGHIYRPKIIDSAGTEVWGDLHIENGILSVTIPQEFLDKAVYPVRHAAGLTFGYGTLGASSFQLYSHNSGARGIPASSGNVSMITLGVSDAGSGHVKGVLYNSSKNIVTNGIAGAVTVTTKNWYNSSYGTSPSVTASGTYYVQGFADAAGGTQYYESKTGQGWAYGNGTYASPENPATLTIYENYGISIYATYTAAAAGPANLKSLNTNLKANIKTINTNTLANCKSYNTNV